MGGGIPGHILLLEKTNLKKTHQVTLVEYHNGLISKMGKIMPTLYKDLWLGKACWQ